MEERRERWWGQKRAKEKKSGVGRKESKREEGGPEPDEIFRLKGSEEEKDRFAQRVSESAGENVPSFLPFSSFTSQFCARLR